MERIILLLVVVLAVAHAGPVKTVAVSRQCSKTCTGSDKLNYEVGKTYRYRYEAEVQASIFGAMEDYSGLHLSTDVQLEILSKCELVMKLTDVTLKEYDPTDKIMKTIKSDFKNGLERNPVRLSFQDGNIEELCLLEQEPEWVINAKRGVISLFQTNMADFSKNETVKETDISGTCDTEYYVQDGDWSNTHFGKSKRLHTCTDRHTFNSAVQGIPYTANSEFQSMPIVKSDQNCQYKVDKQEKYITSVHCQETHVFRPFSRETSGAITKNDQKLTFMDLKAGTSRSKSPVQKVSLKFNHNNGEKQEAVTRKDLNRKLMEICEKTKSGVTPDTPRLFTELVYLVKAADTASLNVIYVMLEKGTICKDNKERASKFFLDTLPLAGTGASLNLMTKLLTTEVITGIEADMWLTSLAFIDNPDITVLQEVKPLINMKGNEEKTLLAIGTLIHSYCSRQENCDRDKTVKALVSALQNKMAPRCKVTDTNFKSTLMALRAIGNAGFAQSAVPSIDLCMKIESNPIEIRLSAIDAYRRMPCTASRNSLFVILKDVEEEPEIRIAAYKSIMECPSQEALNTIRKTLEREEMKQVGSYIWSHLTNLMETSDPHKQGIKEILENESFKKEFDLDMMKYSRNFEKSMFIEPLNTGAKVEGDLIFSPKSFVPRSSMVNLTIDLFGQSVNLIEFGGRVEGIEHFLESFIGPNGLFGDAASKKPQNNQLAMKSVKPDKIRRIDSRFVSKKDNLRASLYMRVFGNELKYVNFRGVDDLLAMSVPKFNIEDMLEQLAKNNDVTYSHSTMFLDSSIVIPTGSGFPMNLTVNGTATMDLKMNGKLNFKDSDFAGYIKPSAAVDISSVMSIDAHVTKCGIKMVSTLHTSTAAQGKIQMSPSGALTAEYEMPESKMEIFDFKSSFFTIHHESEKEQKMIEDNRQTKKICSPEKVVTVTGLELCSEIFYPNASLKVSGPYFPLTGPVSGGLYLYNRDTHTKYTLTAKSVHTRDSNIVRFDFNTPGSKIDRHVALNMNINKQDMSLQMDFASPWKKADLDGTVVNTKINKGFNGKLSIDGSKDYSVKAQVAMEMNKKKMTQKFIPSLEIRAPGIKPIDIQATIQRKKMNFLSGDLSMKGIFPQPFTASFEVKNSAVFKSLKGSFETQKNMRYYYESSLGIKSYGKKRLYKPFVSVRTPTSEVLAIGGNVNHIFGKKIDYKLLLDKIVSKTVVLKGNFRKLTYRRGRVLFGVNTDLKSSPMDFTLISVLDNRNYKFVSTDITFKYNIRGVSRNGFKFGSKINNLSSSSLTKAKGSVNLIVNKNPEYNFMMKGNLDHNYKLSQVFSTVSYGADFNSKTNQIGLAFKMSRNFKTWMKANADLETKFSFPAMDLNLVANGKHSHSDRHLDNSIYLKGGKTYVFESDLHLKDSTEKLIAMTGNYSLNYPGGNFMIKDTIEQTDDNTYMFSMELQPQKNQKHSVVTQLNLPGQSKWNIFSDINLNNDQPIHMEGNFDMNPLHFMTKVSYEKARALYAGSVISKTTDTASDLKMEIKYPIRHVTLNINGQNIKDKYSGFADFKWDAAKDANKKVSASFIFDEPTEEKINGSASLSYPSRDLTFNLLHQVGAKYSTHADFEWEKNKKISTDTTIGIKGKSVICTAKLVTPFTTLPSLGMKLSHNEDNEQYLTKLNVDFHQSESVNMELKLKKPLSLKTFVGYFLTTTSIKGMKRFRVDVDHKLSPMTKIESMVKFSWNKQQIQAIFEIKNTTKAAKVGFMSDLTLKTTYPYMKKGNVKLLFNTDGKIFNTAGSFKRNKKLYEFKSKIVHSPSQNRYDSTGKIDMSNPSGSSHLTWEHRLSASHIKSAVNTNWGKKQIGLKVNGNTNDMKLAINLDTPFKATGQLDVTLELKKDSFPLTASVGLKKDNIVMANAFGYFDHNAKSTEVKAMLTIPAVNIDSKVSGKHVVGNNDISTNIEAVFSPSYNIQANSLLKDSVTEPFTHTIDFQSSFESMKRIMYTAELRKNRMKTFTSKLEYGADPIVEFQTSYLLQDAVKRVEFLLKTPYENMKVVSGNVGFEGSAQKFRAEYSIEVDPLFDRKTSSLTFDMTNGLVSKANVATFLSKYPVVTFDVNANMNRHMSDVFATVEIQPIKPITLKLSHNIQSSEKKSMSASIEMSSMQYGVNVDHSNRNQLIRSEISLNKDNHKYAGVVFSFNNESRIESSLVISMPERRDLQFYMTNEESSTHFEMNHNSDHTFTFDIDFSASPIYKMNVKSLWQLASISPDSYDTQFVVEFDPTQKMTSSGYFVKSSIGKSEFDILFDRSQNMEGSLVVKSPLIKNIKASFNHVTGRSYYESKARLIHGGKEVVGGSSTLNLDSALIGDITFRSAFTKKLQANMRYDGQKDNFVIRTEASYGKSDANIELSSKMNKNLFLQKLSITSTDMKDTSFELSHVGGFNRFTSFGEFNHGREKHRMDLTFETNDRIDWSVSLSSPLVLPMSSRLTLTGTPRNFKGHAEVVRDTKRSDINVELDTVSPKVLGSFDIASPYIKNVALTFEDSSSLPNINTMFKLMYGKSDIYDARVTVIAGTNIRGSMIISTPSDNFEGHMTHEGDASNFKCHGEFKFNGDSSELDVQFSSLKQIAGQISLKSSFLPNEMSFTFDHEGIPKNFKSRAEFMNGFDRTEVTMDVNVENRIFTTVSVKVPNTPKITGVFRHTGAQNNFNTKAEYIYGDERSFGDITITASDNIVTSSLNIRSPYIEDISMNMKHEGELSSFVSTGDVTILGHKSEATVKLNIKSLEASFEVASPSFNLNITHSGSPADFQSSFDFLQDFERYAGNIKVNVGANTDLYMTFTSPIPEFETVTAKYKHTGILKKFNCQASLYLPDGNSEGELKVNVRDLSDMSFVLNLTPTSRFDLKPVKAVYRFKKIKDEKITSVIEMSHGSDKNRADITLSYKPNVQAVFNMNSAKYPAITADFDLTKSPSNFVVNSKLNVDGIEKGQLVLSLNSEKDIEGSFSVKIPSDEIPKVNGDLSMKMSPKYSRHTYKIYVDDIKKGGLEMTLDLDKKVKGSFEMDLDSDKYTGDLFFMKTDNGASMTLFMDLPFKNISKIETDFSFSKSEAKYTSKAGLSINSLKKTGFVSSLNFENGVSTTLTMDLPVQKYPKIDVDFHLNGDRSDFNVLALIKNMDIETLKLVGKFTSINKLSGDFTLSQIIESPLGASFEITGSIKDFSFSGTMTNDDVAVLTGTAKFVLAEKPFATSGSLTINSVNMAYKLETETDFFKSHAKLSNKEMSYVMDASFSNRDDMKGSFGLTMTDADPIKASFFHSLKNKRCLTRVHMEMASNLVYQYNMTLNWQSAVEGDLTLKTPLEKMTLTNLNFKHYGHFPHIRSAVELNNNNENLFKISADTINGEIVLSTASEVLKNIDITYYHEGTWNNVRMGGNVVYAPGKNVKVDFEHMLTGTFLNTRFSLMSMYTDEIVLTAYHDGTLNDFVSKYNLFMGADNKFMSETKFKKDLSSIHFISTATTTMSGETFVQKADLKLDGTLEQFKTEAVVEVMGKTVKLDSSFQNRPIIEGSVKLTTPFESYEEMKASFSHSGKANNFMTNGKVQYMPKQIISGEVTLMNKGWRRMETTLSLKTPFEGLEENTFVYKHTGNSDSFQCDPKLSVGSSVFSGTIKASKSPISLSVMAKSPLEGFESVTFDSNIDFTKKGRYSTRMETTWGQRNRVIFDGYLSPMNNRVQGSASLTTPFAQVRRASVEFSHQEMQNQYTQKLLTTFNGQNLVDLEVDFNMQGNKKHLLTTVRSPRPMKFEITGEFTPIFVDVDMLGNWNMADSNSQIKLETGYDFRFTTKKADFKLTRPGQTITYTGEFSMARSTSDLSWGISSAEKTGFDLKINENDVNLKVIVPGEHARVLEFNGLSNKQLFEGDFYWDAEVDRTKKFSLTMTDFSRSHQISAVSVFLPGLQKTIEVKSDVSVYRGRVIFDGKLSLSFSRDERKKIVMTSRVEDVSIGPNSMNYSMSFGLSQPYTSVGIKTYSHIGKTNGRYSAVMGMEYYTAQSQTKTFHMGGEVDSKNNFMCFEMVNPLKTVNISGNARSENDFHVSLTNKYDQKTPLNTEFTISPSKRQFEFKTNYDLDEPTKALHIEAKYVNSSAIKAEVFRVNNEERITDILATARLNNSHLLHSRLHWRPEIREELEAYYDMKKADYKQKIKEATFSTGEVILEEIYDKSTRIHRMIEEEVGPKNMVVVEEIFRPAQFHIIAFVNRVLQIAETSANSTWNTYNSVMQKYIALSVKAQQTMAAMQSPFMMPLPLEDSTFDTKTLDYVFDMVKIPSQHLSSKSVDALKYVGYILPGQVNTKLANINKNWELEENFESSIEAVLQALEKEILKDLEKLRRYVTSVNVSPFTIYDPNHGEIQAEYYLPIPLKSLDAMPVLDFIRYYEMMKKQSKKISVSVPDFSGEWLPPYTGTAMVSKGKTITTFDGFTYDLETDCTFILTKDYQDGNFTIIRSNGEDPSITILSQSSPVEIKLSGEIFVGGKVVPLPMKNNLLTVNKNREMVTVEGKDFTMRFDLQTDHLTVKINGWYYGKTGGLFGTYDNEPSNDMMTSFNKVVSNSNRFAKTWEVGTATCR